jgi:hypothetical protein
LSSQTNQTSSYEVEIGNLKKILSEINTKEKEILRKIQMQDTKSPIVDQHLQSPPLHQRFPVQKIEEESSYSDSSHSLLHVQPVPSTDQISPKSVFSPRPYISDASAAMVAHRQKELEWQVMQHRETVLQKDRLIDQLLKRIKDLETQTPYAVPFTAHAACQTEDLPRFELAPENSTNERSIVNYYQELTPSQPEPKQRNASLSSVERLPFARKFEDDYSNQTTPTRSAVQVVHSFKQHPKKGSFGHLERVTETQTGANTSVATEQQFNQLHIQSVASPPKPPAHLKNQISTQLQQTQPLHP